MQVIMNAAHTLLPDQDRALRAEGEYSIFPIPAEGLTLEEMAQARDVLRAQIGAKIVFASPIPALLGWLAASARTQNQSIFVLHNDKRDAKEIPDGKGGVRIIHTIAAEGWQLVRVA